MNTDFDFDNIGKRTPYRTPEGLFDEVQRNVMKQAFAKQRRKRRLTMVISTVMAAAALLTGFLFIPSFYQTPDEIVTTSGSVLAVDKSNASTEPSDKWIKELSDEELEELVNFSENDIFLN